jgi:hypothetical protein
MLRYAPHLELPTRPHAAERHGPYSLSLQQTTSGWALFDRDQRMIFEADGPNARRLCLARASALGILRVTFDAQLHAA